MNERFRQLARQAMVERASGFKEFDANLFAELIVRDCLKIVNRHEYSYHEADPLWETAQLIKEHFEVE